MKFKASIVAHPIEFFHFFLSPDGLISKNLYKPTYELHKMSFRQSRPNDAKKYFGSGSVIRLP